MRVYGLQTSHDPGAEPQIPESPEGALYRIGHLPDPWAWPNWANVGNDMTFGNRWDDPDLFRALELLGVQLVAPECGELSATRFKSSGRTNPSASGLGVRIIKRNQLAFANLLTLMLLADRCARARS